MAVSHPTTMRNLITNTVVDTLDTGSTAGQINFTAAASTSLVLLTLASTAFGAASTAVATANTITDGTVTVAGTATIAIFRTSTQQGEAFRCSVTTTGGGGDIELSSNVLSTGQTVSLTSLTYTGPA